MSNITVQIQEKSVGAAYVFWFFLGGFGAHQFYLGKTGRAVSYLLTFGWLTVGLWIDLFTLGKQVRQVNAELLQKALDTKAALDAEELPVVEDTD
jgi:TM2 domain-containing membrane protein YozV